MMRDLMKDSVNSILKAQNLDPEFADALDQKTKALRETKNNNYMDTKQLVKIMNGTDNTSKFTTKKFKSDPLK